MTIVIGLTGNIGSGKSTVAALLKDLGAAIIDADALARLVVEPEQAAYAEIIAAFGPEYLCEDGTLNRRKLGQLVFADEAARLRLNAVTHPRILAEAKRQIENFRAEGYTLIVLEAALLLQSPAFCALTDEIWLVSAPQEQIYQRLQARDELAPEEIRARLAAQMPAGEQAKLCTRHIVNSGGREELAQKLAALYNQVTAIK